MAERTPSRETYYFPDGYEGSPLTDAERETFRGHVRTLLCNVTDYRTLKPSHTDILYIELTRPNKDEIGIEVVLDERSLDAEVIPDERYHHEDGSVEKYDEPPYNLRDIGPEWDALEADLITQLVILLDLPEYSSDLSRFAFDGDIGFLCTSADGTEVRSGTWFLIPEFTQRMYDEDQFDVAEQLRIPMLD